MGFGKFFKKAGKVLRKVAGPALTIASPLCGPAAPACAKGGLALTQLNRMVEEKRAGKKAEKEYKKALAAAYPASYSTMDQRLPTDLANPFGADYGTGVYPEGGADDPLSLVNPRLLLLAGGALILILFLRRR